MWVRCCRRNWNWVSGRFEQYGGFNKGRGVWTRGFAHRYFFGSKCAVSVASVRGELSRPTELPPLGEGGLDPSLGAGTRTHGCKEKRVLSLLLSSGRTVLHWPQAICSHTHRREMAALEKQFYGFERRRLRVVPRRDPLPDQR